MQLSDVRNLNIDLLKCYHRLRVAPRFDCAGREYDGLIYYLAGSQTFEYGAKVTEARCGDVLYLPKGLVYCNRVHDASTEYYEVDFTVHAREGDLRLFNEPRLIRGEGAMQFKPLIYQIIRDSVSFGESAYFACFSNLCKCIEMLLSQKDTVDNVMLTRIMPSVEYINSNYFKNTSIEEIAAMSSTCIANLERLFKKCYGVTPGTYRNIVRVNKGKQLLLSGYSIEEVAAQLGFYDSFHFAKTFKRLTGESPGGYIKRRF